MNSEDMPAAVPALAQAIRKAKKKKKPKKLTAKQKALEKLEKAAECLMVDPVKINKLIKTISTWLKQNDKIVYKMLNQQCIYRLENEFHKKNQDIPESEDEEDDDEAITNTNKISFDDFKIVTSDLGIPCTHLELHALCKLLDPEEDGTIEYKYFTANRIESHFARREIDGIRFINKSENVGKPGAKNIIFINSLAENFAGEDPKYMKIDLRLIAFASDKEYKNHLKSLIVFVQMRVYELIDIIKERTAVASNKITVFRDSNIDSILEENATLASYGFAGGEYNEVAKSHSKTIFFYDYEIIDDNKCPILNSDYYYHDYKNIPVNKPDAGKLQRVNKN